jgi:natural product precursor
MVTKSKSPSAHNNKKRTKLKKLNLTKETVKDLSESEARSVKGGVGLALSRGTQPPPPGP